MDPEPFGELVDGGAATERAPLKGRAQPENGLWPAQLPLCRGGSGEHS
jgi:hypothetical protein